MEIELSIEELIEAGVTPDNVLGYITEEDLLKIMSE
jgi:hypothetical protein